MNSNTLLAKKYQFFTTPRVTEFRSDHFGAVNCLDVDQQHFRFLLSGGADSSVKIWDLETNSESWKGSKPQKILKIAEIPRKSEHEYGISSVQWYSHDAGMFTTSSFDHHVKIWDSETISKVYDFDLKYRVYSTDMSPTGEHALVATATDNPLIRLLDLRTTSTTHTLKGHTIGSVQSIKWSPKEAHLLASGGSDGTVRLWDIRQSRSCLDILDMHKTISIESYEYGSVKRQVGLRANPTYRPSLGFNAKTVAHTGTVNSILWLRDGCSLVSAATDDSMRLWKLPKYSTSPGSSLDQAKQAGYNALVNYGRFLCNRFPQTMYMCLSSENLDYVDSESDENQGPLLFYPSDAGEILIFEAYTGRLVSKVIRPVLPGVSQYGVIPRTTCITARNQTVFAETTPASPIEYFSGALDGTITRWFLPNEEEAEVGDLYDGKDKEILEEAAKSTECHDSGSSSESDDEDSYQFAGDLLDKFN